MTDETTTPDPSSPGRRGPSAPLLAMGLIALGVSAATLFGPAHWVRAPGDCIDLAWPAVVVAVVIGLVLVLAPLRR
jgi:hypothetical protein